MTNPSGDTDTILFWGFERGKVTHYSSYFLFDSGTTPCDPV